MASSAQTLKVELEPEQARRVRSLARRRKISIHEVIRRALAGYEVGEDRDRIAAARQRFGRAVEALQREAVKNGTNRLTMREIDAEIAAMRRERREGGAPRPPRRGESKRARGHEI